MAKAGTWVLPFDYSTPAPGAESAAAADDRGNDKFDIFANPIRSACSGAVAFTLAWLLDSRWHPQHPWFRYTVGQRPFQLLWTDPCYLQEESRRAGQEEIGVGLVFWRFNRLFALKFL